MGVPSLLKRLLETMQQEKSFKYMYAITGILTIIMLIVSYYYVDKPLVLFCHNHGIREYRILYYMQKFPEGFKVLLPFALLWGAYRWYTRTIAYADQCLILGSGSLLILGLVKDPLKFLFGRYWPAPTQGETLSFITDGVYGFNFFQWGAAYQSFPSSHTAAICAVATIMWEYYPRWRWVAIALCASVVSGVIGCYFHFVSDVIAGAFVGIIIGRIVLSWRGPLFEMKNSPQER